MVLQGKKIVKSNSASKAQKIGIVVDDVCSLPEEIIKKNNIGVVKMRLFFEELKKYSHENVYQIMKRTKACPKTSVPSPGQFLEAYKKALSTYDKIIVITVSSKLSGTFNVANQAKKLMPDPLKIEVVDSLSAAAAEGFLVYKAVKLCKVYDNLEEIKRRLDIVKEKIKLFAFLESTFWVEKIGRITKKRALGFKFLKGFGILPIVGIKRGEVGIVGFNFWTTKNYKAIFHQLKREARRARMIDKKLIVGINYTDNKNLALWLKEKVEGELKGKVVFLSVVPLIVGTNSGPGTLIAGSLID